ncbi:MAG: response regulator [Lentisphaerae bacterium]|nr:response regulator [Lentisphaerota bacterium]
MKTILAIDDEPEILACYREALERKGYVIFVTSDPAVGIGFLRENDVDLVLLDVRMPQTDGLDVYSEMRKHKKIPALFITAYPKSFTAESDRVVRLWQNEFSDGTTDIMYKPFTLDALFEKVESLIGEATGE